MLSLLMSSPFFRIAMVLGLVTLVGWGCAKKADTTAQTPSEVSLTTTTAMGVTQEQTTSTQPPPQQAVPAATTPLNALRKAVVGQEAPRTVKSMETYQKALGTYQYRLQFLNCQANPSHLTLKAGLPIMLDNRDSEKHTFKMGKQSFSVLGYDYVIAKAPTPGTYTIICDGGGSAEIQVQG